MNSRMRFLIILALLVAILAAFNPGLDEFKNYVKNKINIETTGNAIDKPLRDLVSGISKEELKEAQEQGAIRKDYVIFSIFEIRNAHENKVHKILGFGKKIFIPLNETPKWDELKEDF